MCQIKLFSSLLLFLIFFVGFSCAEPQCDLINKTIPDLHIHCGYNKTARFDFRHHFNSASRAIASLKQVLQNCSTFVNTMICSLFLPRCTEEIKGPYLPCRGVCYDFANDCKDIIRSRGLEWTVAMCDILPEKDNPQTTKGYRERCFTPPKYKVSGKKYKHNCSDVVITDCKGILGYSKTVVSPHIQKRFASYIQSQIKYNVSDPCSQRRKEIVCAENLPVCIDGSVGFLCRDKCLKFFNTCRSPFFYGSDMCMEFPTREGNNNHSVCKQTHWPRSENWPLPINPTTTPVTPTANSGSPITPWPESTTETGSPITPWPESTIATDTLSPGVSAKQKSKKSSSKKLLVGLVVTFVFLILIALGVIGFVWYRRKKVRHFDYQKQVLYCEDREDEFEIST